MGAVDTAYQNFLRTLLLEGGEMWDASYRVRFNSEQGIDALTRLAALLHTQKVMDPASLSTGDATNLNPLFADGTAAMIFAWPFAYATARKSIPKSEIGNAAIPGIHLPTASIDGSEGFAINRYSRNQLAALEFLKFASSPYCQKRMVVEEGWLPVNRTLLNNPAMVAALPVIPTYKVASKYPIKRYGAPWYGAVCDNYLSTNVSKVMLGELKPKAALNEAARLAQPVIDSYLKRLHIQ
jgi:multiple sugar transport system substrate-binding protein